MLFKNWKLLFKNICENTCGWKSVLKCIKCCLKTKNGCLKTQTKHPLNLSTFEFSFLYIYIKGYISFSTYTIRSMLKQLGRAVHDWPKSVAIQCLKGSVHNWRLKKRRKIMQVPLFFILNTSCVHFKKKKKKKKKTSWVRYHRQV